MKMNPALNCSWLVISFLTLAFLTGCVSTPPADWDSRVGHFTYSQAVTELGPPARQFKLSEGRTEYRWFIQPYGGTSYNGGLAPNHLNATMGPAPTIGPNFDKRVLKLTFDTNGVLTAWSKNY